MSNKGKILVLLFVTFAVWDVYLNYGKKTGYNKRDNKDYPDYENAVIWNSFIVIRLEYYMKDLLCIRLFLAFSFIHSISLILHIVFLNQSLNQHIWTIKNICKCPYTHIHLNTDIHADTCTNKHNSTHASAYVHAYKYTLFSLLKFPPVPCTLLLSLLFPVPPSCPPTHSYSTIHI